MLKVYKDCTISNYTSALNTTGDLRIAETATIQVRKIEIPEQN